MSNGQGTFSNTPEWTVGTLSGAIKRTMEDAFGFVRVRGEVSGYRGPHSSGHVYFALKDKDAKIDAVIWKGVFGRLAFRPEEGLEVIATGKVSTFGGKSSYQLIIENLEPAGLGALMMMLDERRKRLSSEGLFDENKKRPLPRLPITIGIITSPTGAVIRDILHRLADRFPRRTLVWPVSVQGEASAKEVTTAIEGMNKLHEQGLPTPDVIIIARGGGSLEDLWGFNDESLVRAAAASRIPIISAIGHETDWTLLDMVADRRAPTPTAAAEMAVPVRQDCLMQVQQNRLRLHQAWNRQALEHKNRLRLAQKSLPSVTSTLQQRAQTRDHLSNQLDHAHSRLLNKKHQSLHRLSVKLPAFSPKAHLMRQRERLNSVTRGLPLSLKMCTQSKKDRLKWQAAKWEQQHPRQAWRPTKDRLQALSRMLETLSYRSTLKRGFAVVRHTEDGMISTAKKASQYKSLRIDFHDGSLTVNPSS